MNRKSLMNLVLILLIFPIFSAGCITTTMTGNGKKVLLNMEDYQTPNQEQPADITPANQPAQSDGITPFEQSLLDRMDKQTEILGQLAANLSGQKQIVAPEPLPAPDLGKVTVEDLISGEESPPSQVPVITGPAKKVAEYRSRDEQKLAERVARLEGLVSHHHKETGADVSAKFSSGKSELSAAAKKYLDKIAEKFHRGEIISIDEIIGYADAAKPLGEKTNTGIGLERAKAVAGYLSSNGVDTSQTEITYGGEIDRQTVIIYTKKK